MTSSPSGVSLNGNNVFYSTKMIDNVKDLGRL